jgi:D-alanyl-D-alanine carboxypeptidase
MTDVPAPFPPPTACRPRPAIPAGRRPGAALAVLLAVAGGCATAASSAGPAPTQPDTAWSVGLQRALDSAVLAVPLRGASAAVVLADGRVWRGVAGQSLPGVAMDTAMRLGIGSVSKTITAALLVRLAEQGRLSLDDPLSRWLAPMPHVDPAITVRQVLNHTSGVFDVTNAPGYRDSILADVAARWTPQRSLSLLRPALFARGTGWSYSNSNYQLAGLVAEAAGGQAYHQLVRERLLAPLGLTAPFLDQAESPTGPLATGWAGGSQNIMDVRASTYSAAWASGAYFSTPDALARWWQGLMTGRLVGTASLAAMMTPVGSEQYGLGMSRRILAGRTVWSHTGEIRGFASVAVHDPAGRFTVVVIANQNPAPMPGIAEKMIAVAASLGGS